MNNHYHLYLDESTSEPMFCVAGFIVNSVDVKNVETEINRIKQNIWSDLQDPTSIILHEKDVSDAQKYGDRKVSNEYKRFKYVSQAKSLYKEIEVSLKRLNIKIIGSCINEKELQFYYSKRNMNDCYFTAMQNIIENFVQFLIQKNATGEIFLEGRDSINNQSLNSQDRQVRQHYSSIVSIGSMFLSRHAIQDHLKGISFISKTANNSCIQLADFLPNRFARKEGHKSPKLYNLNETLKSLLYDGEVKNKERFGVKVIPSRLPRPVKAPSVKIDSSGRTKTKHRGKRSRGKRTKTTPPHS